MLAAPPWSPENKTFHNQMVLSTTRWYFSQLMHFHMVLPLLLEPWLWKVPSRWICGFLDVVRSNIWFSVLLLGSYPGWYRPAVVRRLRTQCLWLVWKVMTCILPRGLPFCCTWAPVCCIEAGVFCMERQSKMWVMCSAACGPQSFSIGWHSAAWRCQAFASGFHSSAYQQNRLHRQVCPLKLAPSSSRICHS